MFIWSRRPAKVPFKLMSLLSKPSASIKSFSTFTANPFIQNFPYKFNNILTSFYPQPKLSEIVDKSTKLLMKSPKFNLEEGFIFGYKSLLQSIIEGNEPMIDSIWEHKLADTFISGLEKLSEQGYTFMLWNEANPTFKLEWVGAYQIIGAHIDRRRNADSRKLNLDFLLKQSDFFKIYIPKGLKEKTLPMNLEIIMKFTTNFKINVIDKSGRALINQEDYGDNEIHFVRFESVFNEIEFNFSALMNIKNKLRNAEVEFTGWTITDFDKWLNDNPHVV